MSAVHAKFKILSVDGGGIRGACPTALLDWLEQHHGVRVAEYFDLMVGTSTGGLLVLGLASGMRAGELIRFYREHGPRIFPQPPRPLSWLPEWTSRIWRPKYDRAPLEQALRGAFGAATLGDLKHRVVVPTFNASSGSVRLFKTPHHPRILEDAKVPLVEVAMATSAAPTYFPGYKSPDGTRLLDGGLWANNPIAVAVGEAVGVLGVPREQIHVLSLGTAAGPYHYDERDMTAGAAQLALGSGKGAVFAAQMSGAAGLAQVLVNDRDRIVRLDPQVQAGRFSMDRVRDIDDLAALGAQEAKHNAGRIAQQFLDAQARPWGPGRAPE